MILHKLSPYFLVMRLHRPAPLLLSLWPSLWALWLASGGMPKISLIIIFVLGNFFMRSAGCIINDICDREMDKHVERTKHRPITSGAISVKAALLLCGILLLFALMLLLFLNALCLWLAGIAALLTVIYPLCKRFLKVPQLILGIVFNFGVLMAYAAVQNQLPLISWVLFVMAIFWTLSYDTIYAIADMPYDKKLGLHSLALTFEKHLSAVIFIFQIVFLGLGVCVGWLASSGLLFYLCLAMIAGHFLWQKTLWKTRVIQNCLKAFDQNHWVGLLVFIGLIL